MGLSGLAGAQQIWHQVIDRHSLLPVIDPHITTLRPRRFASAFSRATCFSRVCQLSAACRVCALPGVFGQISRLPDRSIDENIFGTVSTSSVKRWADTST